MAGPPNIGNGGTQDTTAQNGVRYLGQIAASLQNGIPQTIGTSSSATGGTATLPGNPVGFLVMSLPGGATVKVPYYAE